MKARSLLLLILFALPAGASSHREAPAVTKQPKLDSTDFYLFRSYEPGRQDYVTIIANYLPLQEPGGGPNYFQLDPDALYEIHIDNDGDGVENLTFQFRFRNEVKGISVPVGPPGEETDVEVPLLNVGPFGAGDTAALNVVETYSLTLKTGDRRTGMTTPIASNLGKPADNVGTKSVADYEAYAAQFVHDITIPGSSKTGRVFVGQRKDPFVVALGRAFDLVHVNPVGPVDANPDTLANSNVTSLCLEIPIECLVAGAEPVIGAWTSASARQVRILNPAPALPAGGKGPSVEGGAWTQVSRLGSPLFNELIVGIRDKDTFSAGEPKDDARFDVYVNRPSVPFLLEALFGVRAPTLFPREDLRQAFLTGVPGVNQPAGVAPAEMLRLNTSTAPTPKGEQGRLGVLDGDLAGFPNGRRPGDDTVDIVLRAAMGVLLPDTVAPDGQLPYTDGAFSDENVADDAFPYLKTPLAGAED